MPTDAEVDLVALAAVLAVVLGARPAWQRDAACQEHPGEWWFPADDVVDEQAQAVCAGCLVRAECRAFAEGLAGGTEGVWAGAAHHERPSAAPERELPPHGSPGRYGRWRCRCEVCKEGHRAAGLAYRQRDAAFKAKLAAKKAA